MKTEQRQPWTSHARMVPDMVGDPTPEPRSAMIVFRDFRRGSLERRLASLQHTREHTHEHTQYGLSLFLKIPKFTARHLFF